LAKLTAEAVVTIRTEHKRGKRSGPNSTAELARRFGVARTTIQQIVGGRLWKHIAVLAVSGCLVLALVPQVRAEEQYDAADTLNAIAEASAEIGVDYDWLYRVVRCEDPTFDPYAVGRQGELGPAQLHPRGLLPKFYALGYDDPFSPYQALRFMAQEFSYGRSYAWSCR
jgi:hypothetical protein